MEQKVIGLNSEITKKFDCFHENGRIRYRYECNARAIYGLGERFCSVNHKGKTLVNRTIDHFTQQNEDTYFPLPFFHTCDGHGVYVRTMCEVVFRFEEAYNEIELAEDAEHELSFYYGTPAEIIAEFIKQTGTAILPPRWSFGVWASANRWNCQAHIEEQLEEMRKYDYPISVIVIEAWSDEATFYLWNGARYERKNGGESFTLKDLTFQQPWPDPVAMIDELHTQGIKLVLWQCPVVKLLEEGQSCSQHDVDCEYVKQNGLVVTKADGTPYQILRQWFVGSMVPDFTNPAMINWWRAKRRYLLEEMGVDGFKTDGGEFIHEKNAHFYDKKDGSNGANPYPFTYESVYQNMVGENRVLFSRAGYIGSQMTPMHWGGDQLSTFSELRSQLNAGLSLSLSGIPFWSFDIGGFAGPLPDKELYLRATALAAFVPAMQWHSEPINGQFEEILKASGGINDRSPWNMAAALRDDEIINIALYYANLHMNFVPHFYNEGQKAVEHNQPLMRHLILDYPEDENAWMINDEYMLGDLLVAPVIEQGQSSRSIYLPKGAWYDLWTGERITGSITIERETPWKQLPLYIREGGAIALNLKGCQLPSAVGNRTNVIQELCIITTGARVNYHFKDEQGYEAVIRDNEVVTKTPGIKLMSVQELVKLQQSRH